MPKHAPESNDFAIAIIRNSDGQSIIHFDIHKRHRHKGDLWALTTTFLDKTVQERLPSLKASPEVGIRQYRQGNPKEERAPADEGPK